MNAGAAGPAPHGLIDSHCHLDLPAFDADREQVLARARARGVVSLVIPGVSAAGWAVLQRLCAQHRGLHPALGLHPVYLARHRPTDIQALEQAVVSHRPLAIGEIGLDFQLRELDREAQLRLLRAQLAIARDAGLPVILHCRKAHDVLLRELRLAGVQRGICHAFNGSLDQGRRYVDQGLRLGFGGMLTYPHSRRLHDLARGLPGESLVLETDAPDMTGAAHHGQRNSPEYLPEVLAVLAELRRQEPAELAALTTANTRAALGLPG